MLKRLVLAGTIVTIDAMGTQTEIAKQIREQKADYVLALKGNQGRLHEDVRVFFEEEHKMVVWDEVEETDGGHGRIEVRSCTATSDIDWLKERHPAWQDLESIVKVQSQRIQKKTGATSDETRYYISSLPAKAKHLLDCTRAHWSIENKLHWQLDVTMREDSCRIRKDHGADNLATIRRVALNILRHSPSKLPIKRRKTLALLNPIYRKELILCVN